VFKGTILECESQFANLHGFGDVDEIKGKNIKYLIPSLILPSGTVLDRVSANANISY